MPNISNVAFVSLDDTQEVFILSEIAADESQGSIRDTFECRGYIIRVVDLIVLFIDGQYYNLAIYLRGDPPTKVNIIGNGPLHAETLTQEIEATDISQDS